MNASAIQLNGISKARGNFQLGPLDLTIPQGYVTAVVGPNGAGKSTLFSLLMNTITPDSGTITMLGASYPAEEVSIKRSIGFVSETTEHPDDRMTVKDWTTFVSRWYPSWDSERYEILLRQSEIHSNKKLKDLSKGTMRRLQFAHALAHNPQLLLLDEPSSGLDPFAWRKLTDEIARFMEQGDRTVLMATHVMDEVRRYADYVVFIHQGKILGTFEKDDLLDRWKIIWVDRLPEHPDRIPGLVRYEHHNAWRLISSEASATEAALKEQSVSVIKSQAMEIDDIFLELAR
jgi:ABC-2 type transport system ATP-binding protein